MFLGSPNSGMTHINDNVCVKCRVRVGSTIVYFGIRQTLQMVDLERHCYNMRTAMQVPILLLLEHGVFMVLQVELVILRICDDFGIGDLIPEHKSADSVPAEHKSTDLYLWHA